MPSSSFIIVLIFLCSLAFIVRLSIAHPHEPVILTSDTWKSAALAHQRSFILFYKLDDEYGRLALRGYTAAAKQDHDPSQDGFFGIFLVQDTASFHSVLSAMNLPITTQIPVMIYIFNGDLSNVRTTSEYLASRHIITTTVTELSELGFRRGRELLEKRYMLESMQKLYILQRKLYLTSTNDANSKKKDNILANMEGISKALSSDPLFAPQVKRIMTYTKRFQERGEDFLQAEKARISGMLRSTSISDAQRHRLKFQKVAVDAFDTSVPKIVHFIKTDDVPERFTLMHYLAVRSAHHHIKPEVIMFHTVVQPQGKWWEKAKKYVSLKLIRDIPTHIGKVPLHLAAHISDALRYQILEKYGGIYMDLDVITIKSFDSLLHYPMTLALEKAVPNYVEVVCNAVIMSKPGHPFLDTIHHNQPYHFKDGCYSCHSVIMIRELSLWHPEEVNILNWESFYYPGWEEEAYRIMFGSSDPSEVDWSKTFAIHLFASHGHFDPYRHMMDEEYILNNDSNFNRLVRQFLVD